MAILLAAGVAPRPAHADEFLDPSEAFVFSAAMAQPDRLDVHFKVAPEYYMYRDRLEFHLQPDAQAYRLGEAVLPPGLVQYDPTFDEDLEVYYGQYTVQLPLEPGAGEPLTLTIVSQGCADAGLCYVPSEHVLTLMPAEDGYLVTGDGVADSVPGIEASTAPRDYPRAQAQSGSSQPSGDGAGAAGAASAGSDAGQPVAADASGDGTAAPGAAPGGLGDVLSLGDTGVAAWLAQAGWVKLVLVSVLFGLLLSFTPCVLPMVPILLAVLAGERDSPGRLSRSRGLTLAAAFVLGMSLVYTALGVAAGLVGASLAMWLQTPWVLTLFAALLVLFALAMFDVFTLQAPGAFQSALNDRVRRIPRGRVGGVFVMGMVSALIVGPCVAAPLAGVLLFISQTGDVVLGGTALFSMAWGQGLLLLAVGASSGVLMPRAGAWMEGVKRLFGVLLLATAWWMMNPVLPGAVSLAGWGVLALWSGVMLGALRSQPGEAAPGMALRRSAGLLLVLWAVFIFAGVAGGGRSLRQPLQPFTGAAGGAAYGTAGVAAGSSAGITAGEPRFTQVESVQELDHVLANTARPVMLDFYADWCVSRIEMETFTFSDPAVAQRMAQFTLVQADVTRTLPEHRELLNRFDLFGPPGIIFFDAQGQVLDDARVVGFQDARRFAGVLDGVLGSSGNTPGQ